MSVVVGSDKWGDIRVGWCLEKVQQSFGLCSRSWELKYLQVSSGTVAAWSKAIRLTLKLKSPLVDQMDLR